jgi:selenocysteine-specific elongation factor
MAVIATAGHVDHGKSSLIRALTGTHPDRLAEEQRKGMTIDLGFAHVRTDSGATLSFIDVPGHTDFIRTMMGSKRVC